MKQFFCIATLLVCFAGSVLGQQKAFYKKGADREFSAFRYLPAATLYLQADTSSLQVVSRLADCYRLTKSYVEALHWSRREASFGEQNAEFFLNHAAVLASNSLYEESHTWYLKYVALRLQDHRALNLSKSMELLPAFYADSARWKISYLSINTNNEEFSPVYLGKGLVFSSNRNARFGFPRVFGWNETTFTDLYTIADTAWLAYVQPKVYFTDSTAKTSGYHKQRLPVSVNDTKVLGDITLPRTLSSAELPKTKDQVRLFGAGINTVFHDGPISFTADGKELMYTRNQFKKSRADDPANGIYKLELYSARYENGKWVDVKPFAYNNLQYSTAHPALSPDGLLLYFVSDMPGGQGGKDIYRCQRANRSAEWGKPENLGSEINTEGDEVFPYVSPEGDLYFSSDGHAGLGGLDIYYVKMKSNRPAEPVVNLGTPVNSPKDDFGIAMKAGRSSGFFSSNRYGSDDIFRFVSSMPPAPDTLKKKTAPVLVATKPETAVQPVTSAAETECEAYRRIYSIANVYYDLDKYNLRPDALKTMQHLVEILKTNSRIRVLVRSHTDSRASDDYNVSLSRRRSMTVIHYLKSHGIAETRLISQYFGEKKLVNACTDGVECSEHQQQLNRRTEFYLLLGDQNITEKCHLEPAVK